MKHYKPLILTLTIFVMVLGLQSCATIFGGRQNSLVFSGDTTAPAYVFIDDSLIGTATGKIKLEKGVIQHGSQLMIKSEEYPDQEYTILLKPHPGYVIADLVVGAIPLIVDFATGDILRPYPRKFEVNPDPQP